MRMAGVGGRPGGGFNDFDDDPWDDRPRPWEDNRRGGPWEDSRRGGQGYFNFFFFLSSKYRVTFSLTLQLTCLFIVFT